MSLPKKNLHFDSEQSLQESVCTQKKWSDPSSLFVCLEEKIWRQTWRTKS